MHGQPRNPHKAEDASKASGLRDLQSQVLSNHRNRIYDEAAVAASAKLLETNPEMYTAWNYRKLALQHNLIGKLETTEQVQGLVNEELRIVEVALRQNPKSYGAWYHRKWVLSKEFSLPNFDREFRLLKELLRSDARNFHGWNYRRFIARLKNVPEEEELNFTMDMINDNFSNYSAWHNRSLLLSHLLKKKAPGFISKEQILMEEYDLVRNALFVDPHDQSGWFYHLWLVDQTVTPDRPLLVSSWPCNGSDFLLSIHHDKDTCNLFYSGIIESYYSLRMGSFPIVLCFNQAVRGVNSLSVSVCSDFLKNDDLVWRPLSTISSKEAHCWVTYFRVPDFDRDNAEPYVVEINLGHSEDIYSPKCSAYLKPMQLKFSIKLDFDNSRGMGTEFAQKIFGWDVDGTSPLQKSDMVSIDGLKISNEDVPESLMCSAKTISDEIVHFKESPEPNSKFVKLTLARLLTAYGSILFERDNSMHPGMVLKLFEDLIKLDPRHAHFYEDERSMVLLNQVTLDYRLKSNNHMPLLLKNQSLTRVGFVDRLLWVKVLDLSHNELHSIAGLEVLQLLTCLNLGHNHIRSFTALAPLRFLSSLRVLDLSYNEIGAHVVDTTRYSCPSPWSHTMDISIKEYIEENIELEDYWEAVFTFKGLGLEQINVMSNPVAADENLSIVLTKLLPSLSWLDGQAVRR